MMLSAILYLAASYSSVTVVREMSICPAHCSWVSFSRSMSRIVSYSSTVRTTVPHGGAPSGVKLLYAGSMQIRRHLLGLAIALPRPCFRHMSII